MNTYKNLQIVQSQFFTDKLIFEYIRISIGLLVFRFVSNKYKQRAIQLHSTIHNIQSPICWEITKVILNYSPLLIVNSDSRYFNAR